MMGVSSLNSVNFYSLARLSDLILDEAQHLVMLVGQEFYTNKAYVDQSLYQYIGCFFLCS